MITASARKARLKAEYEAMCALPYTGLFSWKLAPGQKAPYVTQYLITYNNKTLVKGPGGIVKSQMSTTIQIDINPDVFPTNAPIARVVSGSVPFHPNWWENGNVCIFSELCIFERQSFASRIGFGSTTHSQFLIVRGEML